MWDFADRPLLDLLLERVDGDAELDLRGQERKIPELITAFVPPGFNYELRSPSRIRRSGDELEIDLSISFWPGTDRRQGVECSTGRWLSTAEGNAWHHYLSIGQEIQGRGVGRGLLRSAAEFYAQVGIPEIGLLAMDVGRYVWAMCGFSPTAGVVWDEVREAALKLGIELADGIEYLWDLTQIDEPVTPREVLAAFGHEDDQGMDPRADDLDKPLPLSKALLLFAGTSEWLGKLDLREIQPREQMLDYTDPNGD